MMYHSPGLAVEFIVEFMGCDAKSQTTPFTKELEQLPSLFLLTDLHVSVINTLTGCGRHLDRHDMSECHLTKKLPSE